MPGRKAGGIVQRKKVSDVAALPFLKVANLGQAAAQLQLVVEDPRFGHLLEDDAHAVGEGPAGAAGDRFHALALHPDLGAVHLHAQGIAPMPAVIVARLHHGAIQVGQVVVEQFLVLVQGVRGLPIFQREVGQLLQEGIGKTVEQTRFHTVAHVFAGEKAHRFVVGGQVGAIQEMGDAAVHQRTGSGFGHPFAVNGGHEHLLGLCELLRRNAQCIHFGNGVGHQAHGVVQVLRRYAHGYGIALVIAIIGTAKGMEINAAVGDSGSAEIAFQPMLQ